MNEYEVIWSIYVEADDPIDAALQCKGILQDPGNDAWNFVVKTLDGTNVLSADLLDENDPYIWKEEQ